MDFLGLVHHFVLFSLSFQMGKNVQIIPYIINDSPVVERQPTICWKESLTVSNPLCGPTGRSRKLFYGSSSSSTWRTNAGLIINKLSYLTRKSTGAHLSSSKRNTCIKWNKVYTTTTITLYTEAFISHAEPEETDMTNSVKTVIHTNRLRCFS